MIDRALWLSQRRIGSSDAAAACGIPAFGRDRFTLTLELMGIALPRVVSRDMELGTFLEPLIARWYEEETGEQLHEAQYQEGRLVLTHPQHAFMTATPDRVRDDDGRLVELKWVGDWRGWGEPGTDQVAEAYLLQTMHQMAVSGAAVADIAAAGRGGLRIYTVPRNEQMIALIIAHEADIADRAERHDPPEPDWAHEDTPKLLNMLWRPEPGVEVELADEGILNEIALYVSYGDVISGAERMRRQAQSRIIAAMGTASLARLPDGRRIKRSIVAERMQKAHAVREHVRMDILKAKGEDHGEAGE